MMKSIWKNIKYLLIFFGLSLSLSGCFDFVEEIQLNNDGSGLLKYKLNLSKSKTKLSSIMLMDSIRGFAVSDQDEIHEKLIDLKLHLQDQEGLSDVVVKENWGEYIFEVSLHFDNIESVNHGFESVMSKDQFAKGLFFTPFESSGDRFVRNYVHQDYSSIQGWDRNFTEVFSDSKFTAVYKFGRLVDSQTNPKYLISKNRKAVMFKSSFLDLIKKEATLQNSIVLQ